jgi:hypothetical protein
MKTLTLLFVALPLFAKVEWTAWDHAGFLIQKHHGLFSSPLSEMLLGVDTFKAWVGKSNEKGNLIYNKFFVSMEISKEILLDFQEYPTLKEPEIKAIILDDLSPLFWSKVMKHESSFIRPAICGDLCMIADYLIDEFALLKKRDRDSKIIDIAYRENSKILSSFYSYRSNRNSENRDRVFSLIRTWH